ncbi:hypothetical protein [Corticibacter populi]|nr:hypothetical protein [Corticibacter populi]RZS31874.1 hypothetical protein EV687_2553 [Corticibacter populi]
MALYIVLNAEEPGFDTFVEGRAVAQAIDDLTGLCEVAGLPLPDEFVGQAADELDEWDEDEDEDEDEADPFDGEEGSPDDDEDAPAEPAGQWFAASEGVAYVQALIELAEENADGLEDLDGVLADLRDYLQVLEQAQAARLRWHFAWDF